MEKNVFIILCPVVIEVLDSGEHIIVANFYLNRWASCLFSYIDFQEFQLRTFR